jgi:hypothetical protein
MKIYLEPEVAVTLEAIVAGSRNLEFSGFGFARIDGGYLRVYDFILLHIGSYALTEISGEKMAELINHSDAANMKVWVHRHPMGNGLPGPWNWSGTDNATIENSPLGGIPELVKWSASIVRTPLGWVGRIDNHITKKTAHVPVEPAVKRAVFDQIESLFAERFRQDIATPGYGGIYDGSQLVIPGVLEYEDLYEDDWETHELARLIELDRAAEIYEDPEYYGLDNFSQVGLSDPRALAWYEQDEDLDGNISNPSIFRSFFNKVRTWR